jgi:hypothetical protein
MKNLFFFLLFVSIGCAQTQLPSYIAWDYDYTYSHINPEDSLKYKMSPDDSAATEFVVFYSADSSLWMPFQEMPTKDLDHYILQYRYLYNDVNWYFYCVALLHADTSDISNVIKEYFPQLSPDKTYNLKVLKLE